MSSPGFYSPPPPGAARSNLPMLYYGLIVVGTASVVLALYNLLVLRWCADRRSRLPAGQNPLAEVAAARAGGNGGERIPLPGSFKYKKEMSAGGEEDRHCECAVCLSGFEEGEEIRMLPRCRHAFHAQCIDMWLFSHADCPLCRTPLVAPRRCSRHVEAAAAAEGSPGEVLLVNSGLPV